MPWAYLINDQNDEDTFQTCYQKELQKINQKELRIGKIIKIKVDKLQVKWTEYDNLFNSWIDKKDMVQMNECFPETKSSKKNVKNELDLSNYAKKKNRFKNAASVDILDFANKTDLTNIKSDIDKLDIDK